MTIRSLAEITARYGVSKYDEDVYQPSAPFELYEVRNLTSKSITVNVKRFKSSEINGEAFGNTAIRAGNILLLESNRFNRSQLKTLERNDQIKIVKFSRFQSCVNS